jgi:hypothetical protein
VFGLSVCVCSGRRVHVCSRVHVCLCACVHVCMCACVHVCLLARLSPSLHLSLTLSLCPPRSSALLSIPCTPFLSSFSLRAQRVGYSSVCSHSPHSLLPLLAVPAESLLTAPALDVYCTRGVDVCPASILDDDFWDGFEA